VKKNDEETNQLMNKALDKKISQIALERLYSQRQEL
jgi:hypothetical protein